jgi:hypothetical protein
MTNENGGSRLDRIENILAATAVQTAANAEGLAEARKLIDSNARAIEANSQENAIMREAIIALVDTSELLFERIDAAIERIDMQQSEIRGLQTENRRILEFLERGDSDRN